MDSAIAFSFWVFYEVKFFVIFLFFRDEPATGTLVNGVLSAAFACLVLCVALVKPRRPNTQLIVALPAKLVLAFVLWAGVTVSWTCANSKFIAFGYLGVMALDVSVIYFLLRTTRVPQVAIASLKGLACGALILALVALYFTMSKGIARLGDDSFLHPNVIGNQMAWAGLSAMYLAQSKTTTTASKILWFAIAMVLILTLLQTLSKTAIVAFTISCLVFVARSTVSPTRKVLMFTGITSIFLISYTAMTMYVEQYLASGGGRIATTLSGRTYLWEAAWKLIKENPVVGYGLLSFRDCLPRAAHLKAMTAHDEWLNVWFHYGVVGLVLVAMIYATFYALVRRAARVYWLEQEATLALAFLLFALVRGMTEANMTSIVFPLPLLLLMIGWLTNKGLLRTVRSHVDERGEHLYSRSGIIGSR